MQALIWNQAHLLHALREFTSHLGAALDAANVRKMFKRICTEADVGDGWTPR
ncbi:MAG TPA: hypothetical protein VFW50_07345 [Streptosporangiaceae bacterium]|nr:hypothetical protein [Streptosporangiaceae bacterium]